jgi:phage terminase large subunit
MVKCAITHKQKKMYWHECLYENSNGTDELIASIGNHASSINLIIAESATPRTNYDLKKHFNIKPVIKTNTVADWLRVMQDYEHIITEGSFNLEKEFLNYLWSDKKAGVPVDDWNHLIDAGRYYFMMNRASIRKGIKSSL